MTDFSSLDTKKNAEAGAKMYLVHPITRKPVFSDDEKKRRSYIKFLGEDSSAVRNFQKKLDNEIYESVGNSRKKKVDVNLDADTVFDRRVEKLAIATVEWDVPTFDGEALVCSTANAKRLYSDERFQWVLEDGEEFMKDRANFLPASATG